MSPTSIQLTARLVFKIEAGVHKLTPCSSYAYSEPAITAQSFKLALFSPPVQFDCTNTLNDQILENVTVQMEPTEGYEVIGYVPAKSLVYNQPGTCYTLVALSEEDPTAGKQFVLCFS